MFKKDLTPGAKSKVKSSTQRAIRNKVIEQFPKLSLIIDDILPKKEQLDSIKLPDRVILYALHNVPLFFQHMDDPLVPHLALVHRFPWAFRKVRIDRGAIRFVLSGATLMVPGLTSKGGRLPGGGSKDNDAGDGYGSEELLAGEVVVVEAEGKKTACMVGQLKTGTEEMRKVKKGVAIEGGHFLGDGLWKLSLG